MHQLRQPSHDITVRRRARKGAGLAGLASLALLLLLALLPGSALAQEKYYISPVGSDNGSGNTNSPWATVTHALTQVGDGATIEVAPGDYRERIELSGDFPLGVTVRASVPYTARFRQRGTVLRGLDANGITLEGLDLAQDGRGSSGPLVHLRDMRSEPGGSDGLRRITLRDCLIHDAYGSDLVRVERGVRLVAIEGCMLYNPGPRAASIAVDSAREVRVDDNIFFHDYAASGRPLRLDASAHVMVRDRNGARDGIEGSEMVVVRRNLFLNWQGAPGGGYVVIGEAGLAYHQARTVLVENNLLLGNSPHPMLAPFVARATSELTIRHNTVNGDLPATAHLLHASSPGSPANVDLRVGNNAWSDPTGTMSVVGAGPTAETLSITVDTNLYWNAGASIPSDNGAALSWADEANPVVADPALGNPASLLPPAWSCASGGFDGGSLASIRAVFEQLVSSYGTPDVNSPLAGAANPLLASTEDILGNPRASAPSLGAREAASSTPAGGDGSTFFALQQNEPNPFAEGTVIRFAVPQPGPARVTVYDLRGRSVATIFRGDLDRGWHQISWDGRDEQGRNVAAGAYYYRLDTNASGSLQRKLMHLR